MRLMNHQIFGMMKQMLPYVPLMDAIRFRGSSGGTFSAEIYQEQVFWFIFWFNIKVGDVIYDGTTCDFIMNKQFIHTNAFANFVEKWAYIMASDGHVKSKSCVRILKAGE